MKKLVALFIIYFALAVNAIAQDGWFEQSSGTTNTLYSVHFVNESYGWISGEGSTIKKTTNGGQSWDRQLQDGIVSGLQILM